LEQAATLACAHQDEELQAVVAKVKLKIPLNEQEQHLLYQGKDLQAATDQPAVAVVAEALAKQVQMLLAPLVATEATDFNLPLQEHLEDTVLAVAAHHRTVVLEADPGEPLTVAAMGQPPAAAEQTHLQAETVKMALEAVAGEAHLLVQEAGLAALVP
jgi:hypothetical protein